MTAAAIIREAAADGVSLALSPPGTIKAVGDQLAVNRWLPVLREHKHAIVAYLMECSRGIRDVFERPDLLGELAAADAPPIAGLPQASSGQPR